MTTYDMTGNTTSGNTVAARAAHPSSHQRPDRLTIAAGWSTLTIAVLHTIVFVFHPHWGAWLAGLTRTADLPDQAITLFWALPGGFVAPLAVLGLLMIGAGRRGQAMPGYVGWILLGWILICCWIIGPSGFLLGFVPAALLVWPRRRRGGARPAAALSAP
ncbi:DUF6463 family protein [Ornithinimicrobium faecis]|uniref:DUF6463 family protein n=1 Tax=Ornithinimicrobium faecis TaxID=2934158 RepID=UPI0021193468|nr:DUF6463 family protein [Ornithinimicrobium sp. HY1745]